MKKKEIRAKPQCPCGKNAGCKDKSCFDPFHCPSGYRQWLKDYRQWIKDI